MAETPLSTKSVNLPEELILNILTRLPVKSVGRFRCISRPWLSILTSKDFLKAHFKLHKQEEEAEERLLVVSDSGSLHSVSVNPAKKAVSTRLKLPPDLDRDWVEIAGSCCGLVLAIQEAKEGNSMCLINPTNMEHVRVPNFSLALKPRESFSMHGLGYDESTSDFKVVTLSFYDTDNEYEPDIDWTFVDVYTLKTCSWRRLENSPYDHAVPYQASGVFVNGALHWLAYQKASVIAAFDVTTEKFSEVEAPSELDSKKFVFNKLVSLEGCLCMVVERDEGLDVWMMKEYGVKESWVKAIVVDGIDYGDSLRPLGLLKDHKQVLLGVDEEKLILYDLEEKRAIDMAVNGAPDTIGKGCSYVESLVSPQQNIPL